MPFKDPTLPENIESARASRRKHYAANKEQYKRRNDLKEEQIKAYVREIKNVPCIDCDRSYPYYVMDFDHRDPSQKAFRIAQMYSCGSWKLLLNEIAKCDVVCANCHRERTHGKRNPAGMV